MRWRTLKLDCSYAVGELLIVTAGVLIALGLNQWVNNPQIEAEETLLLQALREEFTANIARLDQEMTYRKAVRDSVNQVFAASSGHQLPPGKSLDALLGDFALVVY